MHACTHLYHVHNLYGIVCILFAHELDEAVALVLLGDTVLGHVHIDHRPRLNKQLPQQPLGHFVVQATDVYGGICGQRILQ